MKRAEYAVHNVAFSLESVQEPEISELEVDADSEVLLETSDDIVEEAIEHTDDAIKTYLRDVRRTKLLSAEEERALALRVDRGDKAARDQMITANLRLVVKIAKHYMHRGLPFPDLIEEGNLGLIKAVERFQLSKECRFSTYATWWIRQSIERALMNQSRIVRLPVHVTEDIMKMNRATREFQKHNNRVPSTEEVAQAMEVRVSHVHKLLGLLRSTYSLDKPMGENNDYFLSDIIEDTESIAPSIQMEALNAYEQVSRHLETFSDTEQKILALRFGLNDQDPQTLETIGHSFGVTRERIRQIEAKAIAKLRRLMESSDSSMAYC
jgi:RNA polymerase primary sigma factor